MKKRVATLSIITLSVLSIGVFIFFKSFKYIQAPPYAVEILAAFLGSIITIIITAVLLNAQSQSEISRDKSIGIFQIKLKVYSDFLDLINEILKDGKISDAEVSSLKEWLLRLGLYANSTLYYAISKFIKQTTIFRKFRYSDLTDAEKEEFRIYTIKDNDGNEEYIVNEDDFISIGTLLHFIREDLGVSDLAKDEDSAMISHFLDEIVAPRLIQ